MPRSLLSTCAPLSASFSKTARLARSFLTSVRLAATCAFLRLQTCICDSADHALSCRLATAITKVAEEKIRPTEEQLSNVDRETPAGQTASTPFEETQAGHLASRAKEGALQAQGMKREAQTTASQQAHEGSEAARGQQTSEFAGQKTEQSKEFAAEGTERVRTTSATADHIGADRRRFLFQTKRTLKERYHGLRERLTGDDDSDKLRQRKDQAQQFLDENFPPERRDQFLWRLKKAIHECQQRDEYDEGPDAPIHLMPLANALTLPLSFMTPAVSSLLDLMDDYRGYAVQLRTAGGDRVTDPTFQRSFEHLQVILARMAGRPLEGVIAAIDQLYDDARHDDSLRVWWADVDAYIRKSLLEPGYIVDDECAREGWALRDRSDAFFKDKVRSMAAKRRHPDLADGRPACFSTLCTRIGYSTRCSTGSRASAKVHLPQPPSFEPAPDRLIIVPSQTH